MAEAARSTVWIVTVDLSRYYNVIELTSFPV